MTSVLEIEEAVARLAPGELAAFRTWFDGFEAEMFDRKLEQDIRKGTLDRLADEAEAEGRRGSLREL